MSDTSQPALSEELVAAGGGRWAVWLKRLMPIWVFCLFGWALWVLHRELEGYRISEIADALFAMNSSVLVRALFVTLLGYLVLAYYDVLALRSMKKNLKLSQMLLASFTGFAVSNSTGQALITGGSLRYRFYSSWGMNAIDVAKVGLFGTLTYFLGVAVLWLCVAPWQNIALAHYFTLGAIGLLVVYSVWVCSGRALSFRELAVRPPSIKLALNQLFLGTLDAVLSATVLYLLVNAYADVSWSVLVSAYLLAQLAGLVSQVPGGLGVFEGSFLALMPDSVAKHELLSALVLFRVIYYVLPLMVAGAMLMLYEVSQRRAMHRRAQQTLLAVRASIPRVYAILLLTASVLLLVSGVTPADAERLDWLLDFLPLPVLEFSHLVGSIVGVFGLLVARAVFLRIDSAYYAAVAMLFIGIVASLLKGADYEEALALCVMLFLFLPTRHFFYRKSALLQAYLPASWWGLTLVVLAGVTWLGFFSYRHVEYANALWWQLSWEGDASRFLRASLGGLVVGLGLAAYRLLLKPHVTLRLPSPEELIEAEQVSRSSVSTHGLVALTGDKYLLFSDSRRAFLMYQSTPRFWIALGDPVGRADEFDQLIWQFRTLADSHGAEVAFYEIGVDFLPSYIDLGMTLLKLGEEARVNLPHFTLQGGKQSSLRNAMNKLSRDGFQFEVLLPPYQDALLERLSQISAEWLERKSTREKGYSLGFFSKSYVARTPIALVKKEGQVYAFANVWQTENMQELSIDLMRYCNESPNGIMEFLTVSLMLWGKENGFRWFNLGMAPLSGLENHPLAPLWHKIGSRIFSYGNEFYNFEGLLNYKRKFNPDWQPRYLAVPSGSKAPQVLMAVTLMIAGGVRGVFGK